MAALKLKCRSIGIVPATPNAGYHVITALSTSVDHDISENARYSAAQFAAREAQFVSHAPSFVQSLRRKGRVAIYSANHLVKRTAVAAVVNGLLIPRAKVEDLAYRLAGPSIVRHMVDEILVEQEARRQNIVVTPAQIDAKIKKTRKTLGPVAFENMVRQTHVSMSAYRDAVRTELASHMLIWKSLGPIKLAHVRQIFILTNADAASNFPGATPYSSSKARLLMSRIQAELRAGKTFDALAKQYSDDPASKAKGGDLGVIQPETQFSGVVYQAASSLKRGEITAQPVVSVDGLHLIMAVSTYVDHPPAEDALYAHTLDHVHMRELQVFLRPYLQHLRSNSKIIDTFANQDTGA